MNQQKINPKRALVWVLLFVVGISAYNAYHPILGWIYTPIHELFHVIWCPVALAWPTGFYATPEAGYITHTVPLVPLGGLLISAGPYSGLFLMGYFSMVKGYRVPGFIMMAQPFYLVFRTIIGDIDIREYMDMYGEYIGMLFVFLVAFLQVVFVMFLHARHNEKKARLLEEEARRERARKERELRRVTSVS